MNAKRMLITPAIATKWLEDNTLQRTLRQNRVDKYAADMKAGRWQENGETIKRTKDGQLLDGQHRLWAILESDTAQYMLVVDGLSEDVMHTIDTGAPRGFSDVAKINGYVNTNLLAATTRMLYWHERGAKGRVNGGTATHSELDEVLRGNPDVVTRISEYASTKRLKGYGSGRAIVLVYTLACRIDEDRATEWLHGLDEGTGLDNGSPVFLMREKLISNKIEKKRGKLTVEEIAALAAKSWNFFIQGKTIRQLRWSESEGFPEMVNADGKKPRTRSRRRTAV